MFIRPNRSVPIKVLKILALAFILIVSIFPVYYMVTTSFKTPLQTYDPSVWIFSPTLENYKNLIEKYKVTPYLINSLIITSISVLLALVLGSLSAYALAKFDFKGKEDVAGWMLSMRYLPAMSAVIPLFLLAQQFHLYDKHIFLIIAYQTFNIPFATWMLRGFFEEIPRELEEAALVDGANRWQSLIYILLPLVRPGLFATAALLVIQTWNEFTLAFFLTSSNARTAPIITSQFQTVRGILWGEMTALGVLTTLPVIVFAILARKNLVRGLTFGAIK
jgi:multiple sugar transport system permease protein